MRLACIALVLATASTVHADDTVLRVEAPQRTFGVDGVAIMPLGNYADAATVGIGAFGRVEFPTSMSGFFTGRLGVIGHQAGDHTSMTNLVLVPVFAGYRQPVGAGGVYVAAELGITFAHASIDNGRFGRLSDTDSSIGFTLSAGLRRGTLDLRAGLFAPHAEDVHGFMASLGYDFAAF